MINNRFFMNKYIILRGVEEVDKEYLRFLQPQEGVCKIPNEDIEIIEENLSEKFEEMLNKVLDKYRSKA